MRKTTRELLGARIKDLRKLRGFSQDQLSERINIDPKHLSRIEVGRSYPSLGTLDKLAKAMNIELKDFFEFTPQPPDMRELKKKAVEMLREINNEEKMRLLFKVIRAVTR